LLVLVKVPFPAVAGAKSTVEKLIGFLPRHFATNKVFTRDDRLSAFEADGCLAFHGSPLAPCLVFLVGQLFPNRFQVLISLLQSDADLFDGFENSNVVNADVHFGLMFRQKSLK